MKNIPIFSKKSIFYGAVAASLMIIVSYCYYSGGLVLKDLVVPLISLFGTFLGATYAFRLNEEKENRKIEDLKVAAVNRALFVLIRQHNAIAELLRNEFLRFPDEFSRAVNMPAITPPPYNDLTHDFKELDFILGTEKPQLLFDLMLEQERFFQSMSALKIRNDHYVNLFQPKLAELGMNDRLVSVGELRSAMGDYVFKGVIDGTNIAFDHMSKSNESLPKMHASLLLMARKYFKGRIFVSYVFEAK